MHLFLLRVGIFGHKRLIDAWIIVAELLVADAHTAVDRQVLVGEEGRLSLHVEPIELIRQVFVKLWLI